MGAFATVSRSDAALFAAFASPAEQCLGHFSAQGLMNTAWAYATSGELAPALLDAVSVLCAMEARGVKPQTVNYQMSMQGFAATAQIDVGLALLARAEANG